jgi:hypothetical protein
MIAQKCRKSQDTNQIVLELVAPNISIDYTPESRSCSRRLVENTIADWIVKPVDRRLALADERFYIHYGSWFAAIQLTRLEAYRAIELVGSSRDSESIWWAIEAAIAGGAL